MGISNPMRWKCDERGCFNLKKRPKIEMFAQFLPTNTSFGDVDAIHEYNGRFIWLEWKPSPGPDAEPDRISAGQTRMFERFTRRLRDESIVICIAGDAETMAVDWHKKFLRGGQTGWHRSSFAEVGAIIRAHWDVPVVVAGGVS